MRIVGKLSVQDRDGELKRTSGPLERATGFHVTGAEPDGAFHMIRIEPRRIQDAADVYLKVGRRGTFTPVDSGHEPTPGEAIEVDVTYGHTPVGLYRGRFPGAAKVADDSVVVAFAPSRKYEGCFGQMKMRLQDLCLWRRGRRPFNARFNIFAVRRRAGFAARGCGQIQNKAVNDGVEGWPQRVKSLRVCIKTEIGLQGWAVYKGPGVSPMVELRLGPTEGVTA